MNIRGDRLPISKRYMRQLLMSFSTPKTPRQIERELNIQKLKTKPLLEKKLLSCLNPDAKKGRLYMLTEAYRNLLNLPNNNKNPEIDWDLIGWVLASPKQRYVIMKTVAMDNVKRTSENIRFRAFNLNPCLSRISTKNILIELINKNLVNTEIKDDMRRYYWIGEKGRILIDDIENNIEKHKYRRNLLYDYSNSPKSYI